MALGKAAFDDELLLGVGEGQEPQLIGNGGLGFSQLLSSFLLGDAPLGDKAAEGPGFFKNGQVLALNILQNGVNG